MTTRRRAGKAGRVFVSTDFDAELRDLEMAGVDASERFYTERNELQARLDAIASANEDQDTAAVRALARGTPSRECARLVKKWTSK